MKQLTSAQIRQMWLDFWKSKGHAVEPSANLVPVSFLGGDSFGQGYISSSKG